MLAFYGLHRYQSGLPVLQAPQEKRHQRAAGTFRRAAARHHPAADLQRAVRGGPAAGCGLQARLPARKLEIQVLDDSTDETVEVAARLVERYAAWATTSPTSTAPTARATRRARCDEGMKIAKGEFVAIFDADFVPPARFPDAACIHHFTDPKVGMVQARWTHLNRHYSFLTEVEAILLDGHFVIEHGGRSRTGASSTSTAPPGMWRREAIDDAGGWQHDTLTEDTDLSYRAQLKGWKFVYLQDMECPAELPVEMNAFKTQQARWAKGLIQCAKKDLPQVLSEQAAPHQARSQVSPDGQYRLSADDRALDAAAAGHDRALLPGLVPDAVHRPAAVPGLHVFGFELLHGGAARALPAGLVARFMYMPFLMALGIGLTITNTKAVLEALVGKQTAFVRTPKYRVESKQDKVERQQVPQAAGLGSLARTADRQLFRLTVGTRSPTKTTSPFPSSACLCSATGTPD